MHLILAGLSHHKTPISLRERLVCTDRSQPEALSSVQKETGATEAVILSTCNRIEVYAAIPSTNWHGVEKGLHRHLARFHQVREPEFVPHIYLKQEKDAAAHLLRVACGLDSLILGEPQILGQVRSALRLAEEAERVGGMMQGLFQQAITCGKRVQTETELRKGSFSIGHAAVELASQVFDNLAHSTVLVLGAGKMSELTARDLVKNGVRFVMVANRTYDRAAQLAERLGGKAVQYDHLHEHLLEADIVISSTAAPHPILRKDMVAPIARRRRGRPLFLIDIAVPRDIETSVSDLDNVFLYNIDDLQEVAAAETHNLTKAVRTQAERIAEEEARKFWNRHRLRSVSPVISDLKQQLQIRKENRLEILRSRLPNLSEREFQTIAIQFQSLIDEIALTPIQRIKAEMAGENAEGNLPQYDLPTAVRELFSLTEEKTYQDESLQPQALEEVVL